MSLPSHTDFKSNVPHEGVRKFNDDFYTVDLRVMVLSDNNPLSWDYMALLEEISKQYESGDYSLSVEKVKVK